MASTLLFNCVLGQHTGSEAQKHCLRAAGGLTQHIHNNHERSLSGDFKYIEQNFIRNPLFWKVRAVVTVPRLDPSTHCFCYWQGVHAWLCASLLWSDLGVVNPHFKLISVSTDLTTSGEFKRRSQPVPHQSLTSASPDSPCSKHQCTATSVSPLSCPQVSHQEAAFFCFSHPSLPGWDPGQFLLPLNTREQARKTSPEHLEMQLIIFTLHAWDFSCTSNIIH